MGSIVPLDQRTKVGVSEKGLGGSPNEVPPVSLVRMEK